MAKLSKKMMAMQAAKKNAGKRGAPPPFRAAVSKKNAGKMGAPSPSRAAVSKKETFAKQMGAPKAIPKGDWPAAHARLTKALAGSSTDRTKLMDMFKTSRKKKSAPATPTSTAKKSARKYTR
jgi:hypothetical protein